MTRIVLDNIDPRMLVSANRRIHWSKRAKVQKYWRYRVLAQMLADGTQDKYERASITITIRYPDRRRRDIGNLHGLVAKPITDGIVDAGVIADDDDTHLIGPDLRRDPDNGPHRVVIDIEEVP